MHSYPPPYLCAPGQPKQKNEMTPNWKGTYHPGGCSPGKCIPLPRRHREIPTGYPHWHNIWAQIHTLSGPNPQKGSLCGTTIVESG